MNRNGCEMRAVVLHVVWRDTISSYQLATLDSHLFSFEPFIRFLFFILLPEQWLPSSSSLSRSYCFRFPLFLFSSIRFIWNCIRSRVCVLRVHAYKRNVQNTKDDDEPILYIFHIRGDCNQRRPAAVRRRGRRCLRQMPPNISLLFCCIQQSTALTRHPREPNRSFPHNVSAPVAKHIRLLCGNRRIDMHRPNGMGDRERNGRWDREKEREKANSTEHCLWCVAWPMSSNCRKTFIARTV